MRVRPTIFALTLVISLGADAYADTRVRSKYTSSGQSNETTIYSKGVRQRFEPGAGMAIINQNDLKRTIQVFDQKKTYIVMTPESLSSAAASAPKPEASTTAAPTTTPTGGIVDVIVDVTDTGEQKDVFGYKARHVKSVTTKQPTAGACDPVVETVETDGWYIDYTPPAAADAVNASAPAASPAAAACHDEIRFKQTGTGKLGYPIAFTLKTTREGKATTMSMEVTEFSNSDLDAALFDIPVGYTEMKSFTDLSALLSSAAPAAGTPETATSGISATSVTAPDAVPAKAAGTIRIGVAELDNKSDKSLGPVSPRDHLISEFIDASLDAIALTGSTPSDVEETARQKQVDYVLYASVTEIKKGGGGGFGRLGGALNKAASLTGGGATTEKLEAKVEYKLIAPGNPKPLVSSSASGSNTSAFSLTSAVHLVTFASRFTPLGMMSKMGMFDPSMMQMMSGSGTGERAGGGGLAGVDPALGSFLSILKTTQSLLGATEPSEEGKATSDAMGDVAKKVADALKKKK